MQKCLDYVSRAKLAECQFGSTAITLNPDVSGGSVTGSFFQVADNFERKLRIQGIGRTSKSFYELGWIATGSRESSDLHYMPSPRHPLTDSPFVHVHGYVTTSVKSAWKTSASLTYGDLVTDITQRASITRDEEKPIAAYIEMSLQTPLGVFTSLGEQVLGNNQDWQEFIGLTQYGWASKRAVLLLGRALRHQMLSDTGEIQARQMTSGPSQTIAKNQQEYDAALAKSADRKSGPEDVSITANPHADDSRTHFALEVRHNQRHIRSSLFRTGLGTGPTIYLTQCIPLSIDPTTGEIDLDVRFDPIMLAYFARAYDAALHPDYINTGDIPV